MVATSWNDRGAALAAQGRHEEALAVWQRGAAIDPAEPVGARNLALALGRAGQPKAGLEALRPAFAAHPENAALHLAAMRLLFQDGEPAAAVASLQRAIARDPDAVRREFPASGRVRVTQTDGEAALRAAVARDPTDQTAWLDLARFYRHSGRAALAEATLRHLLAIAPDNPTARHRLEALTGILTEPRVPDAVVAGLFDEFADNFDRILAGLDYRAPALARDILQRHAPIGPPVRTLDLGCGTGLCGPLLRPLASHLIGVDLSAGMLAKARARTVYDELIEAELTSYLAAAPQPFGLVVAADVLCYFAGLAPVFAAIARILSPGGRFVCTLERMEEAESDQDVLLRHHGRYSHREAHVRAALGQGGLDIVAIEHHRLRNDTDGPVDGLVVLATAHA
jgi:predicted TPR repeat methyltransferase